MTKWALFLIGIVHWTSQQVACRALPFDNSSIFDTSTSSNLTSINQILLQDNVPSDFTLDVREISDTPVFVPIVWLLLFRCIALAAELPFDVRAAPYRCRTGSVEMNITPSAPRRDQPFHMLNNHMVWAIQRLAEGVYTNARYNEVDADIGCYDAIIGRLTVRADRDDNDLDAAAWTSNTTTLSKLATRSNNDTQASLSNLGTMLGDTNNVHCLIRPLANPPKSVHRLKTSLTIIRAIARLAVYNWLDLADTSWLYDDHQMGIGINYGRNVLTGDVVLWKNIVLAFISFMDAWQTASRWGTYYEAEGIFYVANEWVGYGKIQITNLPPPREVQVVEVS